METMTRQTVRESNFPPSDGAEDSIELLRGILASQQQRPVAYSEAQEVGNSLVEFYELLAREDSNESAD